MIKLLQPQNSKNASFPLMAAYDVVRRVQFIRHMQMPHTQTPGHTHRNTQRGCFECTAAWCARGPEWKHAGRDISHVCPLSHVDPRSNCGFFPKKKKISPASVLFGILPTRSNSSLCGVFLACVDAYICFWDYNGFERKLQGWQLHQKDLTKLLLIGLLAAWKGKDDISITEYLKLHQWYLNVNTEVKWLCTVIYQKGVNVLIKIKVSSILMREGIVQPKTNSRQM